MWYALRDEFPLAHGYTEPRAALLAGPVEDAVEGGQLVRHWRALRYKPVHHAQGDRSDQPAHWSVEMGQFTMLAGYKIPVRSTFLGRCRAPAHMRMLRDAGTWSCLGPLSSFLFPFLGD